MLRKFSLDHNNGVVNGSGRNGNILILLTVIRRAYDSAHDSDFRYSLVITSLTTPTMTLTMSLMKTSLKEHKMF